MPIIVECRGVLTLRWTFLVKKVKIKANTYIAPHAATAAAVVLSWRDRAYSCRLSP